MTETTMKITKGAVEVPPGWYYLGDPCYVIANADWQPLLDSCDSFNQPVGCIHAKHVLAFPTAYGDGGYRGSNGHDYAVDSGLIGLVPKDLATKDHDGGGTIVGFTEPTTCYMEEPGVLHFGDITIDTANEVDDEDFYEEEEDEEEEE